MDNDKTRKKFDWQRFLISVLGTAIGVALTFVVNGMVGRRNKEQAQRLTAIMVIHDIDETIDIIKSKVKPEEDRGRMLKYILEHRDHLENVSTDTLYSATIAMVENATPFRFDTSKENIFNSDLDTWQNLGNMKFIDNIQSFFYDRHEFEEWYNFSESWHRPIPRDEYLQLFMGQGWMTMERVREILLPYLKEKLYDKRVTYFIDVTNYRLQDLHQKSEGWKNMNEENKFLMGISDRELEDYINSMVVEGDRVTKRNLTGNWTMAMGENSYINYDFSPDHGFSVESVIYDEGIWESWSGSYTIRSTYSGIWEMKGDSVILSPGPHTAEEFQFELDDSGLEPKEGKRDDMDSWLTKARERYLKECLEISESRRAFHSRMDSSHDKMKWTDSEGNVSYLKR